MEDVFSYHTFILPFIWNVAGSNEKSLQRFYDCFSENPNWVNTDLDDESSLAGAVADLGSDEDAYLFYAEYQYFNPAARRAMYGFDSGIVKNYSFRPHDVRNKGKYIIEANGQKVYTLITNAIRLRIYNTGVALFVLECENRKGEEYSHQNNMDAVKNINDYGRRISMPFLPNKNGKYHTICAEKLTLSIEGIGAFVSDYMGFAKSINSTEDILRKVSLTHMCDFIKEILAYGSDCAFTSNPLNAKEDKGAFYIYPAIDDRMFVACAVADGNYAKHYVDEYRKGEAPDTVASEDLYELVFVDPAHGCSCQDPEMRKELLQEHIYRRWLDYGTITTVANQSLISVSGFEPTIKSFITQYYQLCCLCLAQRASIINFQREATVLSQNIEKQGHSIKTATVARILDLQERFVAFQNQLSFAEVSPQEQGVDLYNMIMESFYIEKEREALKAQLESLYSAANTNLDFSLNKGGTIVAFIAITLALASFTADLITDVAYFINLPDGEAPSFMEFALGAVPFVLMILAAITFMSIKFRRKK